VEEKRIRDLVEHLRELQKKNETLKTRTIQLELENGRLRNDLERITGIGRFSVV
jgi:cell division protein FtsB